MILNKKIIILSFNLIIYLLINYLLINFLIYNYWMEGIIFYDFKIFTYFYGSLDGLSLLLLWLISLIFCLSFIVIWYDLYFNFYSFYLSILFIFLIFLFSTTNLLIFYIFFEAVLIPMFLIIGFLGSRFRKITAAYRFFLYTFLGSIFFVLVLFIFLFNYGTLDFFRLLNLFSFSIEFTRLFWLLSFFTFAVKMPLFPFHTWLPEAHSEAPTVGSIILASLLLKMGPYGLIKFVNFLFLEGLYFFRPLIYMFCLISFYYTSITAIRQLDIKRIIAYSSIGHMALVLLGLLMYNIEGYFGAIILLISHGFVSAGLFLVIGFIYERYKTRNLLYFGGLLQLNPKIGFVIFFFLIANMGYPLTLNFISEIYILIATFTINKPAETNP